MKIWKSFLLLISLIFLLGGGFWTYKTYFSQRKINSLELISKSAIFVLESYQGAEVWNKLVQEPVYQILINFPAFQKFSSQIISLDSLSGGNGKLARSIAGKQITVSLHPTGIETFDLLFSINSTPENTMNFLDEIKKRLIPGTRFQMRKYSDIEILEFFDLQNNRIWSLALLNEQVLASPSSFLLEEAIRFYLSENPESYHSIAASKPFNSGSIARLLLTSKGISSLLKIVSQDRENLELKALESSDDGLILDMTFEEKQLLFKGDLITSRNLNFTPSIKADLTAIKSIVSNRTLGVTQYNLANIFESQNFKNLAFTPKTTLSAEIQRSLLDRGFFDALTGEIYFLNLEDLGNSQDNSALIIRTTEPSVTFELLRDYQKSIVTENPDFYLGNEILHLLEKDFPAHLFAGKFVGFEQTFVTLSEETLIFTNTQEAMKMIIDDQTTGNTWYKFPKNLAAKSSLNTNTGFSKIILVDQVWQKWIQKTNPAWNSFLQKYGNSFRSFQLIMLSINQLNNQGQATLVLHYEPDAILSETNTDAILLKPSNSISFINPLIYGPKSILNFQDQTEDILIQDSTHSLHLINSGGAEVFSTQLDSSIISEVFQIDYYKNGKLQILLATQSKIFGIDRLGNSLPGYPITLNDEQIVHFNLLDYSNDKDYRLFVSTDKGNLYLLDKTGKQLEGWNPIHLGEKTIAPPIHIRIPAKGDIMLAQTSKGNLHFFSRRGEKYPNSPVNLGIKQNHPVTYKYDPVADAALFIAINPMGEIIHYDFTTEKIVYKNQLIREDKDSEFMLIQNQSKTEFIFVSKEYNQITILDKIGNPLFKTKISGQDLIFQYFDFGSYRQIFAVTDLEQNFCYLFDFEGNLMTTMPLESTQPIQITHQINLGKYVIRTVNGNKLTEFQLAE